MHPSRSLIKGSIEDIRTYLNEPTLDAKYNDAYLVRTVLGQAFQDVYSRVLLTDDNPIIVRMALSLVAGTEYYQLPPAVQTVLAIRQSDDSERTLVDWRPEGELHPSGVGWALDGNTLRFNPIPTGPEDWEIWYRPSGNVPFHYAETGVLEGGSVTQITLAATPLLGVGGRFENEYVGQVIRILMGNVHYERVISAYDVTTQVATVRTPFTAEASVSVMYEIVPAGYSAFASAAAARAALQLGIGRKISADHRQAIKETYLSALKTIRDNLSNMQGRTGKYWQKNSVDNPNNLTITTPWSSMRGF